MGNLTYIFCGAVIAISVLSVIFCIVRGKGALRKALVFSVSALGVTALVCFGGQAVLNLFDMGWRCTPFNIMLMLCVVLYIIISCCCIGEMVTPIKNANHANRALLGCGYISLLLAIFMALIFALCYFTFLSWHDGLTEYDGQTIVYANDQHGGSCAWRYYDHINSLVHGAEILKDGWRGETPRPYY